MALTADSTPAEISTAYLENLDYDLDNSIAKCAEFIRACRFKLEAMVEEFETGGARVVEDHRRVTGELEKAEKWRAVHDPNAATSTPGRRVRHRSLREFRS